MRYPLGMMLGGAIANAVSRILFGGVVDYWHVAPYPYVFNAADVAIRLGLVWVLMSFWINRRQTRPGTANDAPKVKES
jgi:signal peptidase II